MQPLLRYRGKSVTEEDASFIRSLIDSQPQANRRRLSLALCEAWNWRQANGQLCDAICRGLLLALHRSGIIELPAPRKAGVIYTVHRRRPQPVLVDQSPLVATVKDLQPVSGTHSMPNVLVVNPATPYKTVQDVVAAAKARPGALAYASAFLRYGNEAWIFDRAGRLVDVRKD